MKPVENRKTMKLASGMAAMVGLAWIVSLCCAGCASAKCDGPKAPKSLAELLPLFTAEGIPENGPGEDLKMGGFAFRPSDRPDAQDNTLPGGGLARHPMIYIGEGCNRIFLVNDGKVIWKYDTGEGWELDDVWMLKNGDILFTRMAWAAKVTPDKREVWRYDCKQGEELHSIQPIGDDEAVMLVNAFPARLVRFNHKTGKIIWEKEINFSGNGTHGQSRRIRVTKDNTVLVCFLVEHKVVEYSLDDMHVVRQFNVHQPWSAIRLKNGNTLVTEEGRKRTIEIDKDDNIVWEISLSELPEKYRLDDCQSACRLQNGNTILCSRGNGGRSPQLVEVTPDKKVVWVLKDWKNLGPATSVQILSDEGLSENPGELER